MKPLRLGREGYIFVLFYVLLLSSKQGPILNVLHPSVGVRSVDVRGKELVRRFYSVLK